MSNYNKHSISPSPSPSRLLLRLLPRLRQDPRHLQIALGLRDLGVLDGLATPVLATATVENPAEVQGKGHF